MSTITDNQRALIMVDVQTDFLPGGALGVTNGDEVVDALILWTQRHPLAFTVASGDQHPANHISFSDTPTFQDKSWPSHCVAGTPGAEIHPRILEVADLIVEKGVDAATEAYSAFEGTSLHQELQQRGVQEVVVGGLATDYCVAATVRDAARLGYQVVVLSDAVRGVDPQRSEEILQELDAQPNIDVQPAGALV